MSAMNMHQVCVSLKVSYCDKGHRKHELSYNCEFMDCAAAESGAASGEAIAFSAEKNS